MSSSTTILFFLTHHPFLFERSEIIRVPADPFQHPDREELQSESRTKLLLSLSSVAFFAIVTDDGMFDPDRDPLFDLCPVLAVGRTQIRSDPVPGPSVDTSNGSWVETAVTCSESDLCRSGFA